MLIFIIQNCDWKKHEEDGLGLAAFLEEKNLEMSDGSNSSMDKDLKLEFLFFQILWLSWFYRDDSSESKLRISRFVDWSSVSRAVVWHVKGKYFSILKSDALQNQFADQCTPCTLHWIKSSIYMNGKVLLFTF